MKNRLPITIIMVFFSLLAVFILASCSKLDKTDLSTTKTLDLPGWIGDFMQEHQSWDFSDPEKRMQFAIALSRWNVIHKTGGPFGAAVFDLESHILVSVGVNIVVPESFSSGHAEVMAITLAQEKLKNFDLGAEGYPTMELVTSSQPCAMCTGAVLWSGVKSVLFGASGKDVERLTGFDEGPVHPEWIKELEKRGITVKGNIRADEAQEVLQLYAKSGIIYNSRSGETDEPL